MRLLRSPEWWTWWWLGWFIIFAEDLGTHLGRLQLVLQRLRSANLKPKPTKCRLLQKQVQVLGQIVSELGIATDPEKVRTVKDWPIPQKVRSHWSQLLLPQIRAGRRQNCSTAARLDQKGDAVQIDWGMWVRHSIVETDPHWSPRLGIASRRRNVYLGHRCFGRLDWGSALSNTGSRRASNLFW